MSKPKKNKTRTQESTQESEVKLTRKVYETELAKLHVELVKLQEWVKQEGLKVCVVFEGRDGAGKGGTIKAITERVSPRIFRVVALPTPTEREKSQMYAQRYIPHFPAAGEVVIFDRSWYNRAGVERIMGFCTEEQAQKFLKMAPLVERIEQLSGQRYTDNQKAFRVIADHVRASAMAVSAARRAASPRAVSPTTRLSLTPPVRCPPVLVLAPEVVDSVRL